MLKSNNFSIAQHISKKMHDEIKALYQTEETEHIFLTECNPGYTKQLLVELDSEGKWLDEGIMLDEWIKSEE